MATQKQAAKQVEKIQASISYLRLWKGFTYEGLGRELGVSHSAVRTWATGECEPRDKQSILELLGILNECRNKHQWV